MRAALGLISLLVVLAAVALLSRKSLDATRAVAPAPIPPAATASAPTNLHTQSQQIQQDYQKALDATLQRPRPELDQ